MGHWDNERASGIGFEIARKIRSGE